MNGMPRTEAQSEDRTEVGGLFRRVAWRFDRTVTLLSDGALWLSVLCLVALLATVLLQVAAALASTALPQLLRWTSASWEYAGYLMGAAFVLAMPATLRAGGHIRVTLLRDHLSEGGARIADIVCSFLITVTLALLAGGMLDRTTASLRSGSLSTASLTPLWIPEAAFTVALALFALQALARLLSLLAGIEAEYPRDLVGGPLE